MRSAPAILAALLLATSASSAAAYITPIDSLNYNYSNGVPLLNRRLVTITGTVTSQDTILSPTNTDVMVQDSTGGVNVFAAGNVGAYHFAFGDSVQVTGYAIPYHGGVEIDSTASLMTVTHLGPATTLPDPMVATASQVANGFNPTTYYEAYQGRLVRVNGLHITAGAWPTTRLTTNTSLTVTDASGVPLTLYIFRSSGANGSPDPGAKFDAIGVVKQYSGAAPPWTNGYELCVRYASDIVPECPGPQYATNPTVTAVDSMTATVSWSTVASSTSMLNYGTTTSYGNAVADPNPGTQHQVTLTGLTPRTLYHMQASATDANGTCSSTDKVLITWPSPGTPGEINVWFNQTVDTTVAGLGVPAAQGSVDISTKAVALINQAKVSVDCALYSFSLQNVVNAMIAAKNRGCTVRFIMDAGNSASYATQLSAAGINWITSTYAGNHGQAQNYGIMHSKYIVVDARSSSPGDAYVWTGSWNCSISGQGDAQNALTLHDWGVAQAYTMDFEQMWGGSGPAPNSVNSRMGSRKSDIIPHLFNVGGRRVEVYMSPSDNVQYNLIRNVWQAQYSQLSCLLEFSADTLSHYMKLHRDSLGYAGFAERLVMDKGAGPASCATGGEYCKLDGETAYADYWSPRADVLIDPSNAFGLLHHKYTIFDNNYPGAALWTGSFNWSQAANTVNDENSVIIHDPVIASLYYQEWYMRYRESGGSVLAGVGNGPLTGATLQLAQSRPNPTKGDATIRFSLSAEGPVNLGVYDLVGRRVRVLADGRLAAGDHEVTWNGRSDDGALQSPGVYFYRLVTQERSFTRKLVLAR